MDIVMENIKELLNELGIDLTADVEKMIEEKADKRCSVGPRPHRRY